MLEQRQRRELEQLEADLTLETQQLISTALLECQDTHNRLKEELATRQKQQLSQCEDETSKAKLIESHQREFNDLEARMERECASVENSLEVEVEAKHARARLELREKHYKVVVIFA